jgi:hypothetical protein
MRKSSCISLVAGPSILVYIFIKTNIWIKIITLLWCLVRCFYMFRRTNAIIKELTWSLQATCRRTLQKNNGISSEAAPKVILHCGCKWIWLIVAGSIGLLWNTPLGSCSTTVYDSYIPGPHALSEGCSNWRTAVLYHIKAQSTNCTFTKLNFP